MTEPELITAAAAGNHKAFADLTQPYRSKLIGRIENIVGEADAEDVYQLALLRIRRALRSFRGDSAFYTWAYRIVSNLSFNHLKARSRQPQGYSIDEAREEFGDMLTPADHDTPEAAVLNDETRRAVADAILALPEEMRRTIMLLELEGKSYEEIAVATAAPIGTVRSRIHRARAAIEQALAA